jgi:hypothetical protein
MTDPTPPAAAPPTWSGSQRVSTVAYAGQPYAGYPPPRPRRPVSGAAIASVVLGLVGVGFGLVPPTFWIAGPLGVAGLVLGLGALGRNRRAAASRTLPLAGTIVSAVALALSVLGAVIFFTAVDQLGDDLSDTGRGVGTAAPGPPADGSVPASPGPGDGPTAGRFGVPVQLIVDGEPAGSYTLSAPVVSARGGKFDPSPENGAYVSVEMTVQALPGKELDFNTVLEFSVRGADGARYDTVLATKDPALSSGTASPRRPATGWITFDAPKHGTIVFHRAFDDDPIAEWKY